MRIAIHGRLTSDNTSAYIQSLFSKLNGYNSELIIQKDFFEFIKSSIDLPDDVKTFASHVRFIQISK